MADQVSVRKEEPSSVQAALDQTKGIWQQLRQYLSDVKVETKRVTWPGKQEIYGTTVMVILTTFIFGIYFWMCDQTFQIVVARILKFLMHRG
jgi:preprotein translocase subunit SecE